MSRSVHVRDGVGESLLLFAVQLAVGIDGGGVETLLHGGELLLLQVIAEAGDLLVGSDLLEVVVGLVELSLFDDLGRLDSVDGSGDCGSGGSDDRLTVMRIRSEKVAIRIIKSDSRKSLGILDGLQQSVTFLDVDVLAGEPVADVSLHQVLVLLGDGCGADVLDLLLHGLGGQARSPMPR